MVPLAEAERSDASKEHLHPRDDRECLAVEAVEEADDRSDAAVDAPFQMELEIDTEDDLGDHEEEDDGAKLGVDVGRDEFPSAVLMTQDVSKKGDNGREDLYRDVPSALDHLCPTDQPPRVRWTWKAENLHPIPCLRGT